MSMAQSLLRVPCQAVALLVVLLFLSTGQLRGLQAASFCKTKLKEEGFELEDASWADDSLETRDRNADLAQLLSANGLWLQGEERRPLIFVVKGGSEDLNLWKGVGLDGSGPSSKDTFLVLGFSLAKNLRPSILRNVYELPHAEVTSYIGRRAQVVGRWEKEEEEEPRDYRWPPTWIASAGYLIPSRPKKQKRCADESSGTGVYLSDSHLVCLELCRGNGSTEVDDCQIGVSLTLPAVRDAHFFSAEGTIQSLRLEGDPLRFQPTALTTRSWDGKYSYSLLHEVASRPWCPALDSASEWYANTCQRGIADTSVERPGWWDLSSGRWATWHSGSALRVPMHATLNPVCLQGTGSYLECGPFAGISIVSNVVFEKWGADCSGRRFAARFAMTAVKPQSSYSWQQGSLSGRDSQEIDSEDILLVAEGLVDVGGTNLCMVACWKRPSSRQDPNSAETCEDCRIGLKLQGPAGKNFTILDRNTLTVTLSSLRTETDPFFFKALTFRGHMDMEKNVDSIAGSGSTYLYSKVDVASLVCDGNVPGGRVEDMLFQDYAATWTTFENDVFYSFPRAENYELQGRLPQLSNFSRGRIQVHQIIPYTVHGGSSFWCPQNVSGIDCMLYRVVLDLPEDAGNQSTIIRWYMEAEGTYDHAQRRLCLIACRSVLPLLEGERNVTGLEGEVSKDCQMSLTVVLTSSDILSKFGHVINGTFRSLRDASDPLFFEPMVFGSSYEIGTYLSSEDVSAAFWVRDIEALESLVASSLSILCIWLQLRHSHRRPKFVPHLSLTMLCTLTAGYALPLVLQTDVFIFLHKPNGGNVASHWNTGELEVVLRGLAFFAVILLLRLIWRVSSVQKLGEETQAAWNEAKVLLISVALYLLGWVIAANLEAFPSSLEPVFPGAPPADSAYFDLAPSSSPDLLGLRFWFTRQGLKKCVGLILDWFLLPQVVANVVWNVGPVQPVSHEFYWGLTFGRSFLHVHDVWRNREMVFPLAGFQENFASPSWNFLSFSWDIIALGISVLLAVVVFFQHRCGGRWFCCSKPRTDAETELSESCKPSGLRS